MSLLVENINFEDTAGNSIIQNTGTTLSITSPAAINLSAGGSVEIPETLNMNNKNINSLELIHSQNNNDLTLSAVGINNVQLRTAATSRLSVNQSGSIVTEFAPICNTIPTLDTEFMTWNLMTNWITYLPELQTGTGTISVTYGGRNGGYLRFGNLIYFSAFIKCSAISTSSVNGEVRITIPIAQSASNTVIQCLNMGFYSGLNTASVISTVNARIPDTASVNYFTLFKKVLSSAESFVNFDNSDLDQTFQMIVSGMYYLF